MTKLIITTISSLLILTWTVQSSIAQHQMNNHKQDNKFENNERFQDVPDQFRVSLTEVVEAYITGKDAFLKSDYDASIAGFEIFSQKIQAIGKHGLTGDGHMAWMESYNVLNEHSSTLTAARTIEDARKAFHHLSAELAIVVGKFGVDGVVYHQYCPMAMGKKGATWLSRNELVQNPYAPETMPACGNVLERFES